MNELFCCVHQRRVSCSQIQIYLLQNDDDNWMFFLQQVVCFRGETFLSVLSKSMRFKNSGSKIEDMIIVKFQLLFPVIAVY